MYNSRLLPALLALSVTSSSCWFRKSPSVFTPPAPQTRSRRATTAENLPPPPRITGEPSATSPPAISTTMPEIQDVPKPAVTPAPRRPRPPVAQTQPTPPPADPPTPAPPKLEQIIAPDQLRGFNRTIDESLDRVRKALVVLGGKSLNAEQNEIANRIRTFQKQAEQAREQDPVTAVSLARRADVLAQDLLQRLP